MSALLDTTPRANRLVPRRSQGACDLRRVCLETMASTACARSLTVPKTDVTTRAPRLRPIRDDFTSRGGTIDGLTILNEHPTPNYYFKQNIIRRVGGFVEISNGNKAHSDAFLRKRIKEVTNVPIIEVFAPSRGARITSVWP